MSNENVPVTILKTPAHVTSLAYTPSGSLIIGSGDGNVRIYRSGEQKVSKAIRALGSEVASVVYSSTTGDGSIWVACGRTAMLFDLGNPKMIMSSIDVPQSLELGEDEEDVLNEIALSSNGTTLAFTTDGGAVGVVDLSDRRIRRMKTRHTNISGSIAFIPNRSNELVSGGYDCALLHFAYSLGNILSRRDFASASPTSDISLSPPFILSLAISGPGMLAVGTADGQLWIGCGGEKQTSDKSGKKQRSKKWEGLNEDKSLSIKIADGPVVAVKFISPTKVVSSTLLGNLALHEINNLDDGKKIEANPIWTSNVKGLAKVNGLTVRDDEIAVGGFDDDGKGAVHVLKLSGVEKGEQN